MEMTVTNGAWNYLVITDHALAIPPVPTIGETGSPRGLV